MHRETRAWKAKEESNIEVPLEEPLTVRVNGRKLTTAMVSPSKIKEFVVGHLLSQGIIKELGDIESLRIEKNEASVVADNVPFEETKEVLASGCGASGYSEEKIKKVGSEKSFGIEEIEESMIKTLKEGGKTKGLHATGLFTKDKDKEFIAKDIGRHNCIDKIIGEATLNENEVDFKESFVVSTGRLSSDMIVKCSNANIPVSASHKSTTSLAIDLAKKSNISLIIYTGRESSVVSNPERIIFN